MPCQRIKSGPGLPDGFICGNDPVYEFEGYKFELHNYFGPIKLKQNGDPAERSGLKFFEAVERWQKLTEIKREKFRAERFEE